MLKIEADFTVKIVDYGEESRAQPSLIEEDTREMSTCLENNMVSLLQEEAISESGHVEVHCTHFEVSEADKTEK